ncbi:DNA polymerase IV [Methanoregula sp.]|uniref:DNA polymerase IV n=1 Tax=Methanoregula sp. TaxID=2052170 RepID=UPI002C6883D0|nr:DNA polymerase IV [Methanoregula sp.]HVP96187.1 DNA polymerase IV [Methanoregula sp.]
MDMQTGTAHQRIILHADMDCFYAAVEMHDRPEIAGKPVIVGADPQGGGGRGVVSTCSYEARAFGVRSAMPISQAYLLCPDAVYLRPDMGRYAAVSTEIMRILKETGYRVQQVSIDEAFLDISPAGDFDAARNLAQRLKQEIHERVGISCSLGVAPSKIVAKIASGYRKPDGLTVVTPDEVRDFLAPLPVRKIPGIGGKTGTHLEALGIISIGELATCDIQILVGAFGRSAGLLREAALGHDDSEVIERDGVKSISKETTFVHDTDNPDEIAATMDLLVRELAQTLIDEGLQFKTVTVRVRYGGFVSKTKATSLLHYHNDEATIRTSAGELLRELWDGTTIRRLGLRLSGLRKPGAGQQRLLGPEPR